MKQKLTLNQAFKLIEACSVKPSKTGLQFIYDKEVMFEVCNWANGKIALKKGKQLAFIQGPVSADRCLMFVAKQLAGIETSQPPS